MSALSPAAVELALSGLYLESSEGRRAASRQSAARVEDWSGLGERLESHGVLALVRRNLLQAGVELPPQVAQHWGERTTALGEDARRFRLTLETLVSELNAAGVYPTLLKGASLGLDLYPEEALRGMGDLDLLIEPSDLKRALPAAERVGLAMGASSFPVWWYRRAHFHLKLRPGSSLLREVELHWALHHPSLLLTVSAADLRRRCVSVLERRAWTLAPEDRLLHLITHLASHAYGVRSATRADLVRVLADPDHPLRLKWVLDIHAEVERRCAGLSAELTPERFSERARAWNAGAEVGWVLEWISAALGFEARAAAWTRSVLADVGDASAPAAGHGPAAQRPLPSLEFRAAALRRFPRWVWPPVAYLERVAGGAGAVRRLAHAAGVLAQAALTALSLPLAWAGRECLRGRRRRAASAALAPERILDQAVALRAQRRGRGVA